MPVETEIKFRVDDLSALALRLQSAGFRLETPRSFESNILYDTPDRQMRARTEILRIRSYAGHWTLTHKRLPGPETPGPRLSNAALPDPARHKHRIETETQIAHGAALAELFLSLGLVAAFRYEKWRTEWADPGEHGAQGHCVIDETPIGNYAELEGSADWIDRAALRLGITPADYITLSYGRLFDQWRQHHRSTADELTFAAVAASMR
jgi:adenylate cyclase, class 2